MFAVIMAGGSGTRFWPASRERLPKQFLAITGERTMLEQTLARAERFAPTGRISVVVGRNHADLTKKILAGKPVEILAEPRGRNTAPCIGLAALHAKRVAADEPLIVLPADHFIADVESFARTINVAADVSRDG